MKSTLAHTRIQSSQHSSAVIASVKQAIQLALDEAGWSNNANANKPKVMVSENKKLKGDSGMHWTIDLVVTDCKEKPIAIIFCIDFSSDVENALNKVAAACQDLYSIDAMLALVIRKDERPLAVQGYDQLFASAHVQTIQWNPMQALELAIDILHILRRRHPRVHGIKSIVQTTKSLAAKYPDLFIDNRQIPKKTDCLELLQKIKEYDPYLHFGEIIEDALSQDGTCQSLVGTKLNSISDNKLEKLLRGYLEQQR